MHNLLLLGGGFAAGFINTLASSGSAVSLPILLFLGLPPHVANATNRLNVFAAACSSTATFARQKRIDWRHVPYILVPTIVGAVIGALLADRLNNRELKWVIIAAVFISLVLVLGGTKRLLSSTASPHLKFGPLQLGLLLLVGIWAGLIVLDSYTYLLLTLILAIGYDLVHANALKAVAGIGFAGASILVFARDAEVQWIAGTILSLGSILGAWLGARLASYEWSKVWVFRVLVVAIVGEIVRML